jgi:DNA-binding NtrC family response regulator
MSDPAPEAARPPVLVVDDDPGVLALLRRILGPLCTVLTAGSLQEASRIVDRCPVHAVLCDHMLPDGRGLEFLQTLHRERSPAPVGLLITGYSKEALAIAAANTEGVFRYLTKPFDLTALSQAVQDALRYRAWQTEALQAMQTRMDAAAADGPDRASDSVLLRVRAILICAALVSAGVVTLGAIALLILYVLKSALGIDIFRDTHLSDWL